MLSANSMYSDVPEVLRGYLNYLTVIKGRSPNTVKEYYYDLKKFYKFIFASINNLSLDNFDKISLTNFDESVLKKVSLNDLYEFMAFINNNHSSNDNYRARKVSCLRSYFNYLYSRLAYIPSNPASNLDSPKIKKRMPRYLTLEESVNFLKSIDGNNQQRDFAMFAVFLSCGLRLSELVGINLRNINFDKRTLRVIGKGNKERLVYLNKMCIDAIQSYLEVRPEVKVHEDMDALFLSSRGRRISNRMVELLAKKYFNEAGIDAELFSPHKLRHTAATLMYKEGNVDIKTLQELLGHTSLATTQIYTHINNDDLLNAADSNPIANIDINQSSDE